MADAYDIMSMAKRSGAQLQLEEDLQRYMDEVRAYQAKKGKKGFWGGLAQMGMSKLLPMLIPGGGTIASMLMSGAVRGGLTDVITQSIKGGTGGQPVFKSTGKGPYGRKAIRQAKREAGEMTKDLREQAEAGRRGDMFTSYLSGFAPDFKELGGKFGDFLSGGEGVKIAPVEATLGIPGDVANYGSIQDALARAYGFGGEGYAGRVMEKGLLDNLWLQGGEDIFDLAGRAGKAFAPVSNTFPVNNLY